ncbi:MAG: hypothetical protein KatS3mg092_0309 [Patescibacteria group bacterium]|nr:MAG: hypothetical protein KatS3mg092_0309 [Patescibacteria group bacterium]
MKTIQQTTLEIILEKPEIAEILSTNFVNISSIARKIKPIVEEKLLKPITLISIIIALKRIKEKMPKEERIFNEIPEIMIKSGFTEIIIDVNKNQKKINNMIREIFPNKNLILTKGDKEITFLINSKHYNKIKNQFKTKKVITNLDILTLNFYEDIIEIPGVYYKILRGFKINQIPLVEIFSTYSQLSLVVKSIHIEKAIKLLKNILEI